MTTPDDVRRCAGCGPAVGRRGALLGAAGAVLLTACGGSSKESGTAAAAAPSPAASAASSPAASAAPAPAAALARLADIAVGTAVSAKAPDGTPLLLVRTGAAQVTGFSAICPHQGCTVAPAENALACPCHGSRFDLAGKHTAGPAPRGLTPFPVTVSGDDVLPA